MRTEQNGVLWIDFADRLDRDFFGEIEWSWGADFVSRLEMFPIESCHLKKI